MRRQLFSVAALCIFGVAAHAATFTTYSFSGQFSPSMAGNPLGIVTGTLQYNNTNGLYSAANLTATGFVTGDNGIYDSIFIESSGGGNSSVSVARSGSFANPYLTFQFVGTTSLYAVSLDGGSPSTNYAGSSFLFLPAPLGPVSVTPEPSSFALLGTGLLGVAGVVRMRMLS